MTVACPSFRFVGRSTLVLGLGLLIVLSGCRTYGQYGNEEAMLNEIQTANDQFVSQLDRAQADAELLQRAAEENADLVSLMERYEAALEIHAGMVEEHADLLRQAEERSGNHRVLRRNFGAIVTDHGEMRNRYRRILREVDLVVNPEEAALRHLEPAEMSTYQSRPPQYDRDRNRMITAMTLEDILR